ncbi:KinB-signaling pathway activation protein [Pseudalkalibacillus berkeleyi]|uniref:KinB-signaling pathway activation protein n=1 Tax=Pseudalkalibacillus berkeleyi TaxID=1069813 RepID=A0ABS9H3H0_9BACL|nr:KinB-signaling pathway activation protein [Pseudalkalibacillus berkeleyi]MCF6139434.1 KinB-signaling pathway activation protein [Pseudalkalibacillus berkeleyi]
MNIKKWIYLFFTTLIIGGASSVIVGMLLRWQDIESGASLFVMIAWLMGFGFIFSIISQMGYFAYLTIHRFGLGIFKSVQLWSWVQILVLAFVVFDLFYLRFVAFEELSMFNLLFVPFALLAFGAVVAYIKMKETNKGAFIPTLFFMVAVTTIEWIPVLKQGDSLWLWLSIVPLLACNAWQVLILHRLIHKKS